MDNNYNAVISTLIYPICARLNSILEKVMLFIEEHGLSRFLDFDEEELESAFMRNCAGIKVYDSEQHTVRYYFFPLFFKEQFGMSGDEFEFSFEFIRPFLLQPYNECACAISVGDSSMINIEWTDRQMRMLSPYDSFVRVDYDVDAYSPFFEIDNTKMLAYRDGGMEWIEEEYSRLWDLLHEEK